jgi:hypothetical protein
MPRGTKKPFRRLDGTARDGGNRRNHWNNAYAKNNFQHLQPEDQPLYQQLCELYSKKTSTPVGQANEVFEEIKSVAIRFGEKYDFVFVDDGHILIKSCKSLALNASTRRGKLQQKLQQRKLPTIAQAIMQEAHAAAAGGDLSTDQKTKALHQIIVHAPRGSELRKVLEEKKLSLEQEAEDELENAAVSAQVVNNLQHILSEDLALYNQLTDLYGKIVLSDGLGTFKLLKELTPIGDAFAQKYDFVYSPDGTIIVNACKVLAVQQSPVPAIVTLTEQEKLDRIYNDLVKKDLPAQLRTLYEVRRTQLEESLYILTSEDVQELLSLDSEGLGNFEDLEDQYPICVAQPEFPTLESDNNQQEALPMIATAAPSAPYAIELEDDHDQNDPAAQDPNINWDDVWASPDCEELNAILATINIQDEDYDADLWETAAVYTPARAGSEGKEELGENENAVVPPQFHQGIFVYGLNPLKRTK